MAQNTAVIFDFPKADPGRDRTVREAAGRRTTIAAFDGEPGLTALVHSLAASGVTLIELCGGVSPVVRASVAACLGEGVKVSSVTFGIESLSAAARYNEAFMAGRRTREAFLFLEPGAPEYGVPFAVAGAPPTSEFYAAPSAEAAAALTSVLVAEGVQLIELYGGFDTEGVAQVIRAARGRAAVGVGSFAIDAVA